MHEKVSLKIEEFFAKYTRHAFHKREILIRAGDVPSGVFYLQEGNIKQYAISQKGEELVVNIFRPITFFPMSWAINDTQNDYFFEAVTDGVYLKAPRMDVIVFIEKNPDVLYDLMSRVYKGTDGMIRRMTYLMAGNAYARLITELLIQAKRFGTSVDTHIEITITEKDLAAQSGMTRETVSRELKKLKDKGLATYEKNILMIHDDKKLEEEIIDGV